MKLLSRVILLVNGAIDAMYNDTMKNNEGAGEEGHPLPVYGMLLGAN